jgi:hypothetical protein
VYISTTLIQISALIFSRRNDTRKRNKIAANMRGRGQIIVDDMILCFKDPKDSTRKLLDLVNTLSKIEKYKHQHKKSSSFSVYQ